MTTTKSYEIRYAQEPTKRPWNVLVHRNQTCQMCAQFETRREALAWIRAARAADAALNDPNYVGSRHHY